MRSKAGMLPTCLQAYAQALTQPRSAFIQVTGRKNEMVKLPVLLLSAVFCAQFHAPSIRAFLPSLEA